jgi:hypothetical protein
MTTIHLEKKTWDAVRNLKYKLGLKSYDEVIEHLLNE